VFINRIASEIHIEPPWARFCDGAGRRQGAHALAWARLPAGDGHTVRRGELASAIEALEARMDDIAGNP
jgi:hypothetical protein